MLETSGFSEYHSAKETQSVPETATYSEYGDAFKRTKEVKTLVTSNGMNDALKYSAQVATVIKAVAIVTVVVVAGIVPIMDNGPDIVFDIFDLKATDTYVFYYVVVQDYDEEMDLSITLQNYFTTRTAQFEGDYASGEFFDLKPNMEYKVLIKNGSRTVAERTIRTLSEEPEPEIMPSVSISNIKYDTTDNNEFTFNVDQIIGIDMSAPHTFNVTLKYVDPQDSGYGPYEFTGSFENVGEVVVPVSSKEYGSGNGYLTIDCDGSIILMNEEYIGEVKIMQG